ncbi:MAG: hypothetical protein GC131_08300 [Alphaproteobacteria bacterium]|nr:hypothetical protein [Alphaproteobacteria bacterium]
MIRINTMFWCLLAILASGLLYHTSYRVQALQSTLDDYNDNIASEQEAIHVLKAEWSYLTSPARLEPLAAKHLGVRRARNEQTITMKQIDARLPLGGQKPVVLAARSPSPAMQRQAAAPRRIAVAEADLGDAALPATVRSLLRSFNAR